MNEQQLAAMKLALEKIANVNAMDYEYQAWAREALAEQPAQQEPVAVVSGYYGGQCVVLPTNPARLFNSGTAFYTAPQPVPVKTYSGGKPWPVAPKPWVGLTETEVDESYDSVMFNPDIEPTRVLVYQAIEAKLKEKNNG